MAKKKTKPTKPRPRPGYRLFIPWLLLLAIFGACSDKPRDFDGDGLPDQVLSATEDQVAWTSGDQLRVATRPVEALPREVDLPIDTDRDGEADQRVPAVIFANDVAGVEVDLDGDGRMDAWVTDDPMTQACIPWGGGCSSGGCCAPFSCMWTGVGINRKKKCCAGTSGSPFFNCQ